MYKISKKKISSGGARTQENETRPEEIQQLPRFRFSETQTKARGEERSPSPENKTPENGGKSRKEVTQKTLYTKTQIS